MNELLQVRVPEHRDLQTYPSRVEDLAGGAVIISWPTFAGARLAIREQQHIALSFVREDAAYLFEAVVEQRRNLPVPQLVIRPTGDAQRVQRRQYFRVKASMLVELSGKVIKAGADGNEETLELRTRTHDISGCGIGIRHRSSIPPGTVLGTKLILPGELPSIKAASKVVHSELIASERVVYHIGMEFITISEPDRTRIIRHIFRIQQTLLT